MPDQTDWVEMTHPGVHLDPATEPARTTREAFDAVWQPKGWTLTDTPPPARTTRPAPASSSTAKGDV